MKLIQPDEQSKHAVTGNEKHMKVRWHFSSTNRGHAMLGGFDRSLHTQQVTKCRMMSAYSASVMPQTPLPYSMVPSWYSSQWA